MDRYTAFLSETGAGWHYRKDEAPCAWGEGIAHNDAMAALGKLAEASVKKGSSADAIRKAAHPHVGGAARGGLAGRG